MLPIILASGSRYRRQLIEKLGIAAIPVSPDIDETARALETSSELVKRLSIDKSLALRERFPEHLIIGSDQVADLHGQIITKPGNHHGAKRQLLHCSGQLLTFHTGLCLYNSRDDRRHYSLSTTAVRFRDLSEAQIDQYLSLEKPYDCAGSFKSEGLGICLLEYIRGDDPNALIGLPLILLTSLLAKEGVCLPL